MRTRCSGERLALEGTPPGLQVFLRVGDVVRSTHLRFYHVDVVAGKLATRGQTQLEKMFRKRDKLTLIVVKEVVVQELQEPQEHQEHSHVLFIDVVMQMRTLNFF